MATCLSSFSGEVVAPITSPLHAGMLASNAKNDDETIKARMLAAEKVYAAIMALQVLALVGGIVLFVVEKCFRVVRRPVSW